MFSFKSRKSQARKDIKLGEYQPGDIDPTTGRVIKYIVFQSSQFMVSIDCKLHLNWFGGDDLAYAKDFGEVVSQVNLTDALVDRIFVGRRNRFAYKKILGDVLSTLLDDGNSKTASVMMSETKSRIIQHAKERTRMSYIAYAIFGVVLSGVLLLLSVIFRDIILEKIGHLVRFRILVCSFLGGIGAFVTTFSRFKNYEGNIVSGLPIHRLDGVLRVFYGLVAGLIAALAIKSKIILGFVDDDNDPWSLYFFAMIAGSSEILIPNLVKEVEKQVVVNVTGEQGKKNDDKKASPGKPNGDNPKKNNDEEDLENDVEEDVDKGSKPDQDIPKDEDGEGGDLEHEGDIDPKK